MTEGKKQPQQPLVRLAEDDFDGAYDDQPSRYAAAA
jgi:hypothetical protein